MAKACSFLTWPRLMFFASLVSSKDCFRAHELEVVSFTCKGMLKKCFLLVFGSCPRGATCFPWTLSSLISSNPSHQLVALLFIFLASRAIAYLQDKTSSLFQAQCTQLQKCYIGTQTEERERCFKPGFCIS